MPAPTLVSSSSSSSNNPNIPVSAFSPQQKERFRKRLLLFYSLHDPEGSGRVSNALSLKVPEHIVMSSLYSKYNVKFEQEENAARSKGLLPSSSNAGSDLKTSTSMSSFTSGTNSNEGGRPPLHNTESGFAAAGRRSSVTAAAAPGDLALSASSAMGLQGFVDGTTSSTTSSSRQSAPGRRQSLTSGGSNTNAAAVSFPNFQKINNNNFGVDMLQSQSSFSHPGGGDNSTTRSGSQSTSVSDSRIPHQYETTTKQNTTTSSPSPPPHHQESSSSSSSSNVPVSQLSESEKARVRKRIERFYERYFPEGQWKAAEAMSSKTLSESDLFESLCVSYKVSPEEEKRLAAELLSGNENVAYKDAVQKQYEAQLKKIQEQHQYQLEKEKKEKESLEAEKKLLLMQQDSLKKERQLEEERREEERRYHERMKYLAKMKEEALKEEQDQQHQKSSSSTTTTTTRNRSGSSRADDGASSKKKPPSSSSSSTSESSNSPPPSPSPVKSDNNNKNTANTTASTTSPSQSPKSMEDAHSRIERLQHELDTAKNYAVSLEKCHQAEIGERNSELLERLREKAAIERELASQQEITTEEEGGRRNSPSRRELLYGENYKYHHDHDENDQDDEDIPPPSASEESTRRYRERIEAMKEKNQQQHQYHSYFSPSSSSSSPIRNSTTTISTPASPTRIRGHCSPEHPLMMLCGVCGEQGKDRFCHSCGADYQGHNV